MPGRAPRNGEQRLTGKQSRQAGKYLRERWTPQTIWSAQEKIDLTAAINALFAAQGEPPMYSTRKLEDWLSNARYRANCKQRAREPESWSIERRAQARKKSRSAQQKQRRDQTAAKLRAVPIATAVPLVVGWAAVPRVQDIRKQFEAPVAAAAEAKPPADAGFGWPDEAVGRPRRRSQEFKAIRDKFEQQRIGRTDEGASHRGHSSAPTLQGAGGTGPLPRDSAHFFEGDIHGARPAKASDELVPTFLSVRGLPLPPAVGGDAMQSSPEVKPAVPPPMPAPLQLSQSTAQQELELELALSIDDLDPGSDLDLDMQGLPVVEDPLQQPIGPANDVDVPAMSFDTTGQTGTEAAGWLSDYSIAHSQSTDMLTSTVDDNVDSDQVLAATNPNGIISPAGTGVEHMTLDCRPLSPRYPESPAVDMDATSKTMEHDLTTVVASAVTATAVDIDLLATPGFLDTDLVTLLPAFDESETPACLPTVGNCGKADYYSSATNQATHPGAQDGAALHSCGYHSHTLQAAHAIG